MKRVCIERFRDYLLLYLSMKISIKSARLDNAFEVGLLKLLGPVSSVPLGPPCQPQPVPPSLPRQCRSEPLHQGLFENVPLEPGSPCLLSANWRERRETGHVRSWVKLTVVFLQGDRFEPRELSVMAERDSRPGGSKKGMPWRFLPGVLPRE